MRGRALMRAKPSTTELRARRLRENEKLWLGRKDSNPRMAGPKPAALPLGDAPILKGKWWFHRGEPGAKLSKKAGEIKEKTRACPNRMKTPITSGNDNNIAKSADLRSGLAFSYSYI